MPYEALFEYDLTYFISSVIFYSYKPIIKTSKFLVKYFLKLHQKCIVFVTCHIDPLGGRRSSPLFSFVVDDIVDELSSTLTLIAVRLGKMLS